DARRRSRLSGTFTSFIHSPRRPGASWGAHQSLGPPHRPLEDSAPMNRTRIGLTLGAALAALALGTGTALAGHGHGAKKAHAVRAAKVAAGLARTKAAAAKHGGGDVGAAATYLGLTVA